MFLHGNPAYRINDILPWDDDVDVSMAADDTKRFLEKEGIP